MTTTIERRKLSADADFQGDLHPLLRRIYQARGISSADEIDHSLQNLLPFTQLLNTDKAAQLLSTALEQQWRILIIGDYDVDGATSTTLAVSALRQFGFRQVDFIIPNRFTFGYGLTTEIVEVAVKRNPDLLITVDNGISNVDGVALAKQHGIKVLITDHHLAGEVLPEADVIVNPNQPDCTFPSKSLAGVGVIFYIIMALRTHLRQQGWFIKHRQKEPNLAQFLDLVALGTVADVVKLDKNNRILAYQGLQRMRAGKARPGINALLTIAKRQLPNVVAADLGFAAGPRLNAAGRLDDMTVGVRCLLASDMAQAMPLATTLDNLNRERRHIEQTMQREAFAALDALQLDTRDLPYGLCLYEPQWHQGVIGILASRVKDRFHRPVIAFAKGDDNTLKGSARSVTGVHIRDVLAAVVARHPDLIKKFGGHAMAAGLTIDSTKLAEFSLAFDSEVRALLSADALKGCIISDGELHEHDFTLQTAEMLRHAGPWGQGFPEPIFDGCFTVFEQRIVGDKHLKLTLGLPQSQKQFSAIAFNIDTAQWPKHRCQTVSAAYRLDVNEYQGLKRLQLVVEHLDEGIGAVITPEN